MLILQSLYFFLPAYFANMAPVFFKRIPFLEKPIWEKKFGTHKTWRGIIVAPLTGMVVFLIQKIAYLAGFKSLALIDYGEFSIFLGLSMGLGAILGDLIKSYYKRKENIKEGEKWVPFDQMDFVIGGLVGSFFFYVPKAEVALIILVASPLLHILVNYIGFLIGVREKAI